MGYGHECIPVCKGMKLVVFGVILAANEYYFKANWWYLFAGLFVLKGLFVLLTKGVCLCHKNQSYDGCCGSGSCCSEEHEEEKEEPVKKAKKAK